MKRHDLKSLSVDQLWTLHEEVAAVLTKKIIAERAQLERKLRQLKGEVVLNEYDVGKIGRARRPYQQVFPKYRNPAQPSETWAGRGKRPRWLAAQLKSGKTLEDFKIQPPSDRGRRRAQQLPRKQKLRRSTS
jgi:DNA-binding protein H-NS